MPKVFDDIYWIDLIIESPLTADLLLGGTLSAIYRLKERNKNCQLESVSSQIIGLDLVTLASFPISRSLDDLIDAVKEWPIFGFNYLGQISPYDNFSNLIKELRENRQIIPILHGFLPFYAPEHSFGLSNGLVSVLSGINDKVPFDGSGHDFTVINTLPFIKPYIEIQDGNYVDKSKITWLGVANEQLSLFFSHMFNMEPVTLNINSNDISNFLSLENKEIFVTYLSCSKLFYYNSDNGDFALKFNRKTIIPKIRSRASTEFADNIEQTHSTGLSKNRSKSNRLHWFYHFNNFFESASTIYIDKLKNMVGNLISSFNYDKIYLIENGTNEIFNSIIECTVRELYGDTSSIVRAVRSKRPRLFPYETINEKDNVLIITDLINTGGTLDKSINIVKQYKADVIGIMTLVANSEKITKAFQYESGNKSYPTWYFMKRELVPLETIDKAQREEFRNEAEDVRYVHDYAFFWELIQKGGDINRKHYIAQHTVKGSNYESHYDIMFEFSHLDKAHDLIQDFLSQFDLWCDGRKFSIIISNTSQYALTIAQLIQKHVGYETIFEIIDFTSGIQRLNKGSSNILLIDDGVNTFSSIAQSVNHLKKLGYHKNEIGICALVERKCFPKNDYVLNNKLFVESNADLFIYYSSAIPFFALVNNLATNELSSCPICYLDKYYSLYKDQLVDKQLYEIADKWHKSLPDMICAPLKSDSAYRNQEAV